MRGLHRIGLYVIVLPLAQPLPAAANASCAMTCADNSPGSTCMSQCSAYDSGSGPRGQGGNARRYGAIAISPSTLAYGTSYRFPTRQQAEAAALTYCHGNAGHPKDCQISSWFWNSCASLALNPKSGRSGGHWGSAWDANRELARKKALLACSRTAGVDCQSVVTFCS